MSRPRNLARRLASRWMGPLAAVSLVVGFCLLLFLRDPLSFWCDDYQVYHLPGYRDMARAWEAGEAPLLSPSSWNGGALAGEYLYGTFSIFIHLAVVLVWKLNLSLPATAAAFSFIHLAVLATGVFFLARQRGLATELAILATVVASLNGWMIAWAATAWIPALTTFAWVPWAWWGMERALESRRGAARFLPAGFFIYLNLTGGWPFPVLMTVVVTLFLALRTAFEKRRLRALWPLLAAWAWGAALAAPALLMLIEHYQHGLRAAHQGLQWQWVVPLTAILGLVFPYYTTDWVGWAGTAHPHPAVELACGLLPPVVLAAALVRLKRSFLRAFRWDLALLGLTLLLAVLPSVSPFRFSFRWLPLFHLVLGLLAAHALSSLRADEDSRAADPKASPVRFDSFAVVSLTLAFLILERTVALALYGLFIYIDFAYQGFLGALALLVAYPCWIWLRRVSASLHGLRRWLPCILVMLSLWATYSQVSTRFVKRWNFPESLRRADPLDPGLLYLSVYSEDDAYRTDPDLARLIRPGNTAMLSGVRMVNGYSPVFPAGLAKVLGMRSHLGYYSKEEPARRILEHETGQEGLLELMGVDGIVLSSFWADHADALLEKGWEKAHSSEVGVVLHRSGPRSRQVRSLPSVEVVASPEEIAERILERSSAAVPRLLARSDPPPGSSIEYSPCRLETIESSRLRVEVRVESPSAELRSLVVFARPWYPGYRATLDGRPLEVEALNLILPAVELPAGAEGLLVLEYAPAKMRIGLGFSALALLLGAGIAAAGRRRPGGSAGQSSIGGPSGVSDGSAVSSRGAPLALTDGSAAI